MHNALPYGFASKRKMDWAGLPFQDFGARMYDSQLGRWNAIDPLATKFSAWSPYHYSYDSPVAFVDPNGKDIFNTATGVTFTGRDAQTLFRTIQKNLDNINFFFVHESKTPEIYKHTLKAFREGHPTHLHYDKDPIRKEQRRSEATKVLPSLPWNSGLQRDEYPFASTFEGGKGASVMYVPRQENGIQAGDLSWFYSKLKQGEEFIVLPVPKNPDEIPTAVPEPSSQPDRQRFPVLLPRLPIPIQKLSPQPSFNPLFILPFFYPPEMLPRFNETPQG